MPGWQRAKEWTESNKVYTSPGEYVEIEPEEPILPEDTWIYEIRFDKTINLFVSPGEAIEITRILEDNYYKLTRDSEYPGGLQAWIKDIIKDLCDANWNRTNFEVGGGFVKPTFQIEQEGHHPCEFNITYRKYIKPKRKITAIRLPKEELVIEKPRKPRRPKKLSGAKYEEYKRKMKQYEKVRKQYEKIQKELEEMEKEMEETEE